MYYSIRVKDHVRVPPSLFGLKLEEAVRQCIKKEYEGHISGKMGFVIDVMNINSVQEGVIIPGDGASFHESEFDLLTFRPDLNEIILGKIRDIADFGAFITLGPAEGMIHISQTMEDYVSFAKDKVLQGRESGRTLKVGDKCRARIIAVSFKDITNPKIGLTMRQQGLGKLEWKEEQQQQQQQQQQKKVKKEKKK